MTDRTVLILGGTWMAADLARRAQGLGSDIIYSLAGRTTATAIAGVEMRSGGFGGAEALAQFLNTHNVDQVIDATHPYAAQISANAISACTATGTALLRLQEPAWEAAAGDQWFEVPDIEAARDNAADMADRVFVTTGRQELTPFATDTRCWWLARVIAPGNDLPNLATGEYLFARGPFEQEEELALLREHGIAAVISKNAGGKATYGKIAAARMLGLPVIMVARPRQVHEHLVTSVDAALAWLG